MSTTTPTTKVPLASLPLPPSTHILHHNLTPDPHTPSPSSFHNSTQRDCPSIQRRARLLAPPSHFSFVTPCVLPFPYRMAPEEGEEIKDQTVFIEKWLKDREPLNERPLAASTESINGLKKLYPETGKRDQEFELIGLSETCIRDCLPHLDVGDAFDILGSPTLANASEVESSLPAPASEEDIAARQELIDVLSGHATLMAAHEDAKTPWAPWSLRYSGHQFGTWAGQLGDGRAISILATPHPEDPDTIYELQLKGAGRTPFSRGADGLAVVRSSIREFLCAEAMHALSIPTTRSLSLISLPSTPVIRERLESACVLTRIAPSFIRIGSFEALNPPANIHFFGGGQQDGHWDALRRLGEWVGRRVVKLEGVKLEGVKWTDDGDKRKEGNEDAGEKEGNGDAWGKKLVLEVARRNAKMVAGWQAYGFMHGVINTDNVSVLGLTIDYGPYAFMDVFDQFHICNHTDGEGRYAYNAQPSMIIYALRALLNALAPLIGAEADLGNKAVPPGWADGVSDEKISEWKKKGLELVKDEMEALAQETCAVEYGRIMHKRLALRRIDKEDESKICRPLLDLMEEHKLDFHSTFRRLAYFRPSIITRPHPQNEVALQEYIESILELAPDTDGLDRDRAINDIKGWLKKYAVRIEDELEEWVPDGGGGGGDGEEKDEAAIARMDAEREQASKSANPRFVLRQWVLEEVIKAVEKDATSGKRILRKILQMACNPFEPWGAEDIPEAEVVSLSKEIQEERRFCGLGERRMLGFQCSCSS